MVIGPLSQGHCLFVRAPNRVRALQRPGPEKGSSLLLPALSGPFHAAAFLGCLVPTMLPHQDVSESAVVSMKKQKQTAAGL